MEPIDLVNSSGFPLQIALQYLVETTYAEHKWKVTSHEHYWLNKETGKEGFIDLILNFADVQTMVVECKRVQNSYWAFLIPSEKQSNRRYASCWATSIIKGKKLNIIGLM